MVDFFETAGVTFNFSQLNLTDRLKKKELIPKLDLLTAVMHQLWGHTCRVAMVDDYEMRQDYGKPYLNEYHMRLAKKPYDEGQCNLILKNPPSFYSRLSFFNKSLAVGAVAALATRFILG